VTNVLRPRPPRAATTRRRLGACLAVVGIAAVVVGPAVPIGAGSPVGRSPAVRACSVRPAADDAPMGTALVGMVRQQGATLEMLHVVTCTDGTTGYTWIGGDVL